MPQCAAPRCSKAIHANYLMCGQHWMMVPPHIKTAVWREFHAGERKGTHPTREYAAAVQVAREAVIAKEASV